MQYRNLDKQALKENAYTTLSKITIVGTNTVFTEDDYIVNWDYEDYRYVPDTGFIGQFVERILDGNLQNISEDVILEDKEINLQLGIVNGIDNETTWYDYGNFLITKVEKTDTTGNYKFESADYTKKFNKIYEDNIEYPCIAAELVDNVCEQVGVKAATNGYLYVYIPEEHLSTGNYCFYANNKYYNFSLTNELNNLDCIYFNTSNNILTLKRIINNKPVRTNINYTTSITIENTPLTVKQINNCEFTNNDFVILNNQYEPEDTCRKVMQDIGKLAYSWVRVAEDNKVYIDFAQVTQADVDNYDKLTTDEYYVSKKSDLTFGPVNKILIGMQDIEGENLCETSQDYTEETESAIKIWDNNLTYTEELRAIALDGCDKLFGLTYTPIEIQSIGHPWLEGDELIQLTNVDDEVVYTYPFNRKISYAGYIEGVIGAEASTTQNSEYEYKSDIISDVRKTSIVVDKNNQTITALVSNVQDINDNINTSLTVEGNPLIITNAGNYNISNLIIYGTTEGITGDILITHTYQGGKYLITQNNKYLLTEEENKLLLEQNGEFSDTYTYNLEYTLRYVNGIYDELDIATGVLTKRISDTGTILPNEEIIQLDPYSILLHEGYNSISISPEPYYISATYLTNSNLNSQYTTKSEFKVTTDGITSTVERLDNTVQDVTGEVRSILDTENTVKGNPVKIEDCGEFLVRNIAFYGNLEQDGTPTPDNPIDINVVEGEHQVEIKSKNLYHVPNNTQTGSGIDVVTNNNIIYLDGIFSSSSSFDRFYFKEEPLSLEPGTYTITYVVEGYASDNLPLIRFVNNNVYDTLANFSSGSTLLTDNRTFTISETKENCQIWIDVNRGDEFEEFSIKLQLEKGDKSTSVSNIYISPQILKYNLNSIQLSKLDENEDKIYYNLTDEKWYIERNVKILKFSDYSLFRLSDMVDFEPLELLDSNGHFFTDMKSPDSSVISSHFTKIKRLDSYLDVLSENTAGLYTSYIDSYGDSVYHFSILLPKSIFGKSGTDYVSMKDIENWFETQNVTFHYPLETPEVSEIEDYDLVEQLNAILEQGKLYETNMIVEDVANDSGIIGDIEVNYLTNTTFNGIYASRAELNITQNSIESTVSETFTTSVQPVIDSVNVLGEQLQNTEANLQSNIDDVSNSLENYALNSSLVTVTNTVQNIQTALNQQILISKELQENGVTKVTTTTGFTFDENGLAITKTGADTKTVVDEDGLTVYSATGSSETPLLDVNSQGVETENLHVRTYTQIGSHSRLQDYEDGTAIFYIA